jgi:hypothetical protein
MSEANANYVSKREFRLVALGLVALLLVAIIFVVPQRGCPAARDGGKGDGGKGGDSPILVRGGAMTAFTVGKGAPPHGWGNPSGSAYCIDVDTSYIEFDNVATGLVMPVPNLTPEWVILIYGHSVLDYTSAATHSSNGFEFDAKSIDCQGHASPGKVFLHLSSMPPGAFYPPPPMASVPPRTDNLRFRDKSCGVDEDFCERIAEVDVISDKGKMLLHEKCIDGDCSVVIGKPQP